MSADLHTERARANAPEAVSGPATARRGAALGGQDFGAGKDTPKKWQKWWSQNRSRILKEDAQQRADYKKSLRKR